MHENYAKNYKRSYRKNIFSMKIGDMLRENSKPRLDGAAGQNMYKGCRRDRVECTHIDFRRFRAAVVET